ncbi:hypothetical protein FOA52_006920 [Chlamydomonas sp. UWO 241]|nr:hypothetical protein FOA52_006920 [Chlamydomonas sp. UWO 241]
MSCSRTETCYTASDVFCSGTPTTCPTQKTDGETPEMTGCSATDRFISGAAPYNVVCYCNMIFDDGSSGISEISGLICSGGELCYAASNVTCSGNPITCPAEKTDGETPEMTGCSATGVSINGSAPYNVVCKGDMNFGGDGMICSSAETCYAASDMTCTGTPIDCPNGPSVMTYKYRAYLKGKKQIPKIVTKMWGWGYAEWSTDSTMASITVESPPARGLAMRPTVRRPALRLLPRLLSLPGQLLLPPRFVLSIPVAAANDLVACDGYPGMVGCYPGEEEAAKAAEQVTAAVKSGVSLPVSLASGLVRYLHQIRGSVYAPVGGGVVSASFLNAKHAVGGIGVEPRRGDMLRVLFAVESDAVADAVVRNRCCLCGLGPSVAVFDVLSDREEARHQALWPAFLAAKAAGKRVQFHRARLVVDGARVKNAVDVFAAHMHNCSADCSGPVVVTIFNFADADGTRLYTSGDISTSLMVDLATNPMLGELIMSGDA